MPNYGVVLYRGLGFYILQRLIAGMAELVDALDLGSSGLIRGGSSPFACTN